MNQKSETRDSPVELATDVGGTTERIALRGMLSGCEMLKPLQNFLIELLLNSKQQTKQHQSRDFRLRGNDN